MTEEDQALVDAEFHVLESEILRLNRNIKELTNQRNKLLLSKSYLLTDTSTYKKKVIRKAAEELNELPWYP